MTLFIAYLLLWQFEANFAWYILAFILWIFHLVNKIDTK